MSTIQSYYSVSPATTSLSRLSPPYSDVKSWVGVGCNSNGSYWAFLGFTKQNFTGGEWKHGYTEHYTKIKYDESLSRIHLIEADNGRKFLDVAQGDTKDFIKGVMSSNKIITGVQWYAHNDVWFEYSMKGSAKSINAIFDKCGLEPLVQIKDTSPIKIDSDLIDRALASENISPPSSLDESKVLSLPLPKNGDWTVAKLSRLNHLCYHIVEQG